MKRLTFVIILMLFILNVQELFACGPCNVISVDKLYSNSDMIFSGKVTQNEIIDPSDSNTEVIVDKVYKGNSLDIVSIQGRSMCAYRFQEGTDYLIYAIQNNGVFWADNCSGTKELSMASGDLEYLEKMVFDVVEERAQTYTVERVIDGDTLQLANGDVVKLIGINVPPIVFSEGIDPARDDPPFEVLQAAKLWDKDLGKVTKMGQEATEFVKGLIKPGQEVRLEFDVQEKDKYGRQLGYLFIDTTVPSDAMFKTKPGIYYVRHQGFFSLFVNATIIKAGYAQPLVPSEVEGMTIPPNVKYADLFRELYEEARENKRGLWAHETTTEKKFEPAESVKEIPIPMH